MLAAPLTWGTPIIAYVAWSAATLLTLGAAAWALRLSWVAMSLALLSPPLLYCLATGQSGGIVSTLLLLSLFLSPERPILPGLLGGCLIVKPQFAVLLPVCSLASGNFRAFFAAGAAAATLCLVSLALFGPGLWQYFDAHETGMAWAIMSLPWPQAFQGIMVSPFMLGRSLGAGLHLASSLQLLVTLGAAGAAWRIWRPRHGIDRYLQLLLTLCLAPLATPYAYIYSAGAGLGSGCLRGTKSLAGSAAAQRLLAHHEPLYLNRHDQLSDGSGLLAATRRLSMERRAAARCCVPRHSAAWRQTGASMGPDRNG